MDLTKNNQLANSFEMLSYQEQFSFNDYEPKLHIIVNLIAID